MTDGELQSVTPTDALRTEPFHAALGFAEVGTADVYAGSRTVRYLSRTLS